PAASDRVACQSGVRRAGQLLLDLLERSHGGFQSKKRATTEYTEYTEKRGKNRGKKLNAVFACWLFGRFLLPLVFLLPFLSFFRVFLVFRGCPLLMTHCSMISFVFFSASSSI